MQSPDENPLNLPKIDELFTEAEALPAINLAASKTPRPRHPLSGPGKGPGKGNPESREQYHKNKAQVEAHQAKTPDQIFAGILSLRLEHSGLLDDKPKLNVRRVADRLTLITNSHQLIDGVVQPMNFDDDSLNIYNAELQALWHNHYDYRPLLKEALSLKDLLFEHPSKPDTDSVQEQKIYQLSQRVFRINKNLHHRQPFSGDYNRSQNYEDLADSQQSELMDYAEVTLKIVSDLADKNLSDRQIIAEGIKQLREIDGLYQKKLYDDELYQALIAQALEIHDLSDDADGEAELPKKDRVKTSQLISRRDVVAALGTALGANIAKHMISKTGLDLFEEAFKDTPPEALDPTQPESSLIIDEPPKLEQKVEPAPTPEKIIAERFKNFKDLLTPRSLVKQEIIATANDFMHLHQSDSKKEVYESALVLKVLATDPTPGDLSFLLKSVMTQKARQQVLLVYEQKIQNGELSKFGMEPLPADEMEWCQESQVPSYMLSMAKFVRPMMVTFLEAGKKSLFSGLSEEELNAISMADRVPTSAEIAMLMKTETTSFTQVGTETALSQLGGYYLQNGRSQLEDVAKYHQDTTGLPYDAKTIPGSLNIALDVYGITNVSGGAIGPQFMPDNAKFFIDVWKFVQLKLKQDLRIDLPDLNLWDPVMGTLLTFSYIAASWYKGRVGYDINDPVARDLAFGKWNNHAEQISKIRRAFNTFKVKTKGRIV